MITTHVLDTAQGKPAIGIPVELDRREGASWRPIGHGATDPDGRLRTLWPAGQPLIPGTYRLRFDTQQRSPFFPEVMVVFNVTDAAGHYHLPLLLSPHGYSTYRGS